MHWLPHLPVLEYFDAKHAQMCNPQQDKADKYNDETGVLKDTIQPVDDHELSTLQRNKAA